jgi:serine/threonine-protein kinase
MNEPHDPNRTIDITPSPDDSLDAGLAAGFGRPVVAPRSSLKDMRPVLLRDAEVESAHVVTPTTDAIPAPSETGDRYQLAGEIARGGMGAVLRGRDVDLGRELAVKVLLEKYADRPEVVRRFVEEAQIGGQLQHPGVVPVYDIGRFGDRPFFTMKLIKGRTLAALLSDRPDPTADRPRLLSITLQVAQTLAYAHAKGVIHRDLKPANIMVGAFGEVQVMDWGLAKVLVEGEVADEERASRQHQQPEPGTQIRTARSCGSAGDGTDTEAGSLLGTPAYMPPEQANGDIALLDRRADVFGLGAILCEILTGEPPYVGRSAEEVRRKSANGDLADAVARLEACGADTELITLARTCLSPEAIDRPKDAQAVAEAMRAYLDGVQARLHKAELAETAAKARAVEEAKRRRLAVALAAIVVLAVTLGGGGWLWFQRHEAAQAAEAARRDEELRQGVTAALVKVGDLQSRARWPEARAVLDEVEQRLGATGFEDLHQRLADARGDLDLIGLLEQARMRGAVWTATGFDNVSAARGYTAALRDAGLLNDDEKEETAAARIRDCRVRDAVVAALDDLTSLVEVGEWQSWLLAVTRRADPHPWRDRFRSPDVRRNRQELQRLANEMKAQDHSPQLVVALAKALDLEAEAIPLLESAQRLYPSDFWINFWLGFSLWKANRSSDAVGYYRVALAIRPEATAVHNNLGLTLSAIGHSTEAIAVYEHALALDPKHAVAQNNLAVVLLETNRVEDAHTACLRAVDLAPEMAQAHSNLGNVLRTKGRLDEALASYARSLALDPRGANTHFGRAQALERKHQFNEAIASYQQGLDLDPNNVEAHNNLGALLCDQKRDYDQAVASFRRAIALAPNSARSHFNLGNALQRSGHVEEAVTAYRRSLELNPRDSGTHTNLGTALHKLARLEEAITAHRQAVTLNPKDANALTCLGNALREVNRFDEALAIFQKALEMDSDSPNAHGARGQALLLLGRFAEARNASQRALDLLPMDHPLRSFAQRQLRQCERLLALEQRLPALLGSRDKPADAQEAIHLGEMCARHKKMPAAAAQFYGEAFTADPRLAENLQAQHRYNAACSAALAGGGQGEDVGRLDDKEQSRLRQQALDWLRADLTGYRKLLESSTVDARGFVQQQMQHWQTDTDLASLRDAAALARYPTEELIALTQLWAEVASLLKRAEEKAKSPRSAVEQ